MKKFKKMLLVLAALALMLSPILSTPITANAAEPATYSIRYVPSLGCYRFQTGSWVIDGYHRGLDLLNFELKDGDHLVIDATGAITLDLTAHLGSLTVIASTGAVVTAPGYDHVYTLGTSVCAINGDVTNAHVYDGSTCNFNNNVTNIEIIRSNVYAGFSNVNVLGTVAYAKIIELDTLKYEYWNFQKNAFVIKNGVIASDLSQFQSVRDGVVPSVPATTPSTPVGEYDAVPKTSDVRFNPLWLVGLAGLCLVGSYALKRKAHS